MEKIYFKTLNQEKKPQADRLLASKNTITLNQVHGNKILVLEDNKSLEKYYKNKTKIKYDGVITNQKNLYLTIKHADCCPLFLYSENLAFIGMLHCGWRSVQKGIIEAASKVFQKKIHFNQKVFFSLGPTICKKCYVVKDDLKEKFIGIMQHYQLEFKDYFFTKNDNLFFDLKKIIRDIGLKNGFYFQKNSHICTLEHANYFSHRQNKTKERNISFIIKK